MQHALGQLLALGMLAVPGKLYPTGITAEQVQIGLPRDLVSYVSIESIV